MEAFAATLPAKIDALWNFGAAAETETKFQELLAHAKELGGNADTASIAATHPQVVELLTQIARTQGLQRKFDEAHETLDTVLRILVPSSGSDRNMLPVVATRASVRYSLERGRVYNSSKQKELALPLFVHAWNIAQQCQPEEEDLAIDAAHMVAIAEPSTEKQTQWNLLAIAKAEAATDAKARKWIGSLTNNLGWTFHDAGKYTEALAMFEKALAFRHEAGEKKSIVIARWSVARCLRSLGRVDEALAIQLALVGENAQLGEEDGYNSEEIGELLLLQGKADEAKPHFKRAAELLGNDAWFVDNEKDRLERLQQLGGAVSSA